MYQSGIKQQPPTIAGVNALLNQLSLGDRFVLLFNEPASAHPHQLLVWHGVVVATPERWRKRAVCCARFEEGGHDMVYPLPPPHRDVTVVDVIRDSSFLNTPFSPPPQLLSFASASTLTAPPPLPDNERDAGMSSILRSFSTDMVHALRRRLYPHRKVILWVCMPTISCDELVDNLDSEIVVINNAAQAQTYIRENITSILAVVTSSLRSEFEKEGICGPDLCNLARDLRSTVPLPEGAHPGERCWPLAILATRTLPMYECVQSCDIFVNSPKSADSICLTEISRRVAPPSVVCVGLSLSDDLQRYVEQELAFSIHHFDTTYRAYQFVVACPWNVASIITDRCQDLHREGHITGVELGQRVRQLNLSRFRNPHLILVGAPDDDTKAFDHVMTKDELEGGALKRILTDLSQKQQRVRVPGAVVFGRGANTSLNPTFPSPFEVTIDGATMIFPNVEQFFQAAKHYGNRQLFSSIRDAPNIHGALQLAWNVRVDPHEWNAVRDEVMLYALSRKFSCPEFMEKLLLTGDKDIVHATLAAEDKYWGDGADGGTHHGRNRMGEMLMTLRSMLMSHVHPTHDPSSSVLSSSQRSDEHGATSHDIAVMVARPESATILQMDFPLKKLRLRPRSSSRSEGRARGHAGNVFDINYKQVLGRGAYGNVYKARDLHTNQIVAAKVANVAHADEALRKEFQLLATVDDPNVVRVLHAELPDSGTATIYMEYMSGGSLEEQARSFRLYEVAIRNCVFQILEGLDALHRQYRIVHCDLKPGNVLTSGQVVKLSDFGASAFVSTNEKVSVVAPPKTPALRSSDTVGQDPETGNRSFDKRDSGSSTPIAQNPLRGAPGTPEYMSLTRMETNEASYADDVWAVGCIVVRLALGGPYQPWWDPKEGLTSKLQPLRICHLMTQEPFHPYIPTQLSPCAKQFVLRCFTADPLKRPTAGMLSKDPWFASGTAGMEPLEDYRAAKCHYDGSQPGDEQMTIGATIMMETGYGNPSKGAGITDETGRLCREGNTGSSKRMDRDV